MGIKETRKKIQRTIVAMAQCEKPESVLHELQLIQKTVSEMIKSLGGEAHAEDTPTSTKTADEMLEEICYK